MRKPTEAERTEMRAAIGERARDGYVVLVDSAVLKRLLDWLDAEDVEIREAIKFGDTESARIKLAHICANLGDSDDQADNEASSLLGAWLALGGEIDAAERRGFANGEVAALDRVYNSPWGPGEHASKDADIYQELQAARVRALALGAK